MVTSTFIYTTGILSSASAISVFILATLYACFLNLPYALSVEYRIIRIIISVLGEPYKN